VNDTGSGPPRNGDLIASTTCCVIEFLLAAALSLLVAYFVIRKAVQAILDADAERGDDARRDMGTSHVLRHSSEADRREHPPPDHEHPLHDNAASSLGSADGPDARSRWACFYGFSEHLSTAWMASRDAELWAAEDLSDEARVAALIDAVIKALQGVDGFRGHVRMRTNCWPV
jgi:hypothetical protein